MKTFGGIISQYRNKRGLSQRELARSVKLSASYLNEIENGLRGAPSPRVIKKLAKQLKAPLEVCFDVAARENDRFPPDLAAHIKSYPETLELLRTVVRHKLPRQQVDGLKKYIECGYIKAIILAAGMGVRMGSMTKSLPKCLAIRFNGKSLLQSQLDTLMQCGIKDIVIVRGYEGEKISVPKTRYIWNRDYETTNVLESLMCAETELQGDVIISYSDIWYQDSVLRKLLRSDKDIAIGVDIDWKDYYEGRKLHPIEEAENVIFDSDNRVRKIGKIGATGVEVHGEFIGMMKLTYRGCQILKAHHKRAKRLFYGKPFQRAKEFKKAYLTDLLQDMADLGVPIHCEVIGSQWKEIDTVEDFRNVQRDFALSSKKQSRKK